MKKIVHKNISIFIIRLCGFVCEFLYYCYAKKIVLLLRIKKTITMNKGEAKVWKVKIKRRVLCKNVRKKIKKNDGVDI